MTTPHSPDPSPPRAPRPISEDTAQGVVTRPDPAWVGQGTALSPPKAKRRCPLWVV